MIWADNESPDTDQSSCKIETTQWSSCSVSCGVGVSIRMTKDKDCQPLQERRLCIVRPCDVQHQQSVSMDLPRASSILYLSYRMDGLDLRCGEDCPNCSRDRLISKDGRRPCSDFGHVTVPYKLSYYYYYYFYIPGCIETRGLKSFKS